jgi:hypothetical protein
MVDIVVDIDTSWLSAHAVTFVGLLSMAWLVPPTTSPFLAMGGTAIDLTPLELKDFAVRAFGSYDKAVLLLSIAVVIGLVGVVAGLVSRRSRVPGLVLILLHGVIDVAAMTRRNAGQT